jgi:Mn-dependent DtxR family transcriptional regulator
MNRPAPALDRIYSILLEEQREGRPIPSYGEIAARMGWRKSSARDALNRLIVRGLLLWKSPDPRRCHFRINQG